MATDPQTQDNVLFVTTPAPDPRSALIVNTYLDTDRLIGLVQPTVWFDRGIETARRALEGAHAALINARYLADLTTANRLQRAVAAANDIVIAANHARSGNDHEMRVGVGMALCIRTGRTATMALVPPSQALLFQGGTPTWCPRRESWVGDDPGLTGSPLGWTSNAQPTLVSTVVDHSDELLLTTSRVASILARSESLPRSTAMCDQIATIKDDVDPVELIALATRFEPPSVSGNIRSASRHMFGHVDRRARAVWAAIRNPA